MKVVIWKYYRAFNWEKQFKSDIIGQKSDEIGQNRTKSDKIERKIELSSIEMLDVYYKSDFNEKNDF